MGRVRDYEAIVILWLAMQSSNNFLGLRGMGKREMMAVVEQEELQFHFYTGNYDTYYRLLTRILVSSIQ